MKPKLRVLNVIYPGHVCGPGDVYTLKLWVDEKLTHTIVKDDFPPGLTVLSHYAVVETESGLGYFVGSDKLEEELLEFCEDCR